MVDHWPSSTVYRYPKVDGAPKPCRIPRRRLDGAEVFPAGFTLHLTTDIKVIVQCRAEQSDWDEKLEDVQVNEGDPIDELFWSFNLGHELLHALTDNRGMFLASKILRVYFSLL